MSLRLQRAGQFPLVAIHCSSPSLPGGKTGRESARGRTLIWLATPAGAIEAKTSRRLDCQTVTKARIEAKGLFPAVANHAGRA